MGSRGPAPTRGDLRVLKGNGKDRDVASRPVAPQPLVVPRAPAKPIDLGEHGERVWDTVTPELVRLGILGQVDAFALEAFCRTYQLWKEHDGGRGYPAITASLTALGSKLGLDPASRLRMTLPEARDGEEDDIFGPERTAL